MEQQQEALDKEEGGGGVGLCVLEKTVQGSNKAPQGRLCRALFWELWLLLLLQLLLLLLPLLLWLLELLLWLVLRLLVLLLRVIQEQEVKPGSYLQQSRGRSGKVSVGQTTPGSRFKAVVLLQTSYKSFYREATSRSTNRALQVPPTSY